MAWWRDTPLRTPRRRLAGAERGSRISQVFLHPRCERVRAPEHAPRNPFGALEHCHGLAQIVERRVIGSPEGTARDIRG